MKKSKVILGLFVLCLCLKVSQARAEPNFNWAVNGDFKSSGGWVGNITTQPGYQGQPAAYLENTKPQWTEYSQRIDLPQPPPGDGDFRLA